MKFKLDENLGKRGKRILESFGFNVATVYEQGLQTYADQNLISACKNEQRCLVTLDLDFANTLVFRPSKYHGLAVIRLPDHPTADDMNYCLDLLARQLTHENIDGKLWIVQRSGIREFQQD